MSKKKEDSEIRCRERESRRRTYHLLPTTSTNTPQVKAPTANPVEKAKEMLPMFPLLMSEISFLIGVAIRPYA